MLKRFVSFAAMAVFGLVLLAACGGTVTEDASEQVTRIPVQGAPVYASPGAEVAAAGSGTPADVAQADAKPAPAGGGAAAGAGAEQKVVAKDLSFAPTALTIPAGADAVVDLSNEGALPHNFAIDQLKINQNLDAGAKDIKVTINAPAGTYEYYCNIPGHKEAGMVGTLTVK